MALAQGQLLHGRYQIQGPLGHGGMGAVYLAYDQVLNHRCAVKELVPPHGMSGPELAGLRQQFRQEAQVLANLDHPSLPHVIDCFSEGANEYLVMDYVEGESLDKLIQTAGKQGIEEQRVLEWARQLLDALAYCHSRGVIHRDVKPANIIIRPDTARGPNGRAVLVDFGLVKSWNPQDPETRTAVRGLGTPEYAPPEQYYTGSGHTDPRSDLYSLGATLYHALTGQAPLTAAMRMAAPDRFMAPRTLRRNLSATTEAVILRAMEMALNQRFKSAEQMHGSLIGTSVLIPRSHLRPPMKKRALAYRLAAGTVGFLLIGLFAFGGIDWPSIIKALRTVLLSPTTTPVVSLVPTATLRPTLTPYPTWTATARPSSTPRIEHTGTTPTTRPAATSTLTSPSPSPSKSPPPASTPSPTSTRTPATPGVITDFEVFGYWKRGDEANGTLSQSRSQVHQGSFAAVLNYQFSSGDNDYVVFMQPHPMAGQPTRITAWVYGDASGHFFNVWVKDSGGQVWQVPLGRILHSSWQQMSGIIDVGQEWPWAAISGSDNGYVDYPITFQALVLDDNPDLFKGAGAIYIDEVRYDTESALPTARPSATSGAAAAVTPAPSSPVLNGRIAFSVYNLGIAGYMLYTLDLPAATVAQPVANYVHQPDFSPDGLRIAVDGAGGGKDDLWHFKFDGTDWRQISVHPDDHFPTWSKDGQLLAFSSTRWGDGVYRLYLWTATGDSPVGTATTELTIGDYPVLMPNWEIVFNGCDYGWGSGTRCGLWRMSDGHMPASLTDRPEDFPTDGSLTDVLFLRSESNDWEIYRVGATGGSPVRLTNSPGRDGPATFSPDGASIAFLSERSGTWALYVMDRQGNNVRKLIDLPQGGNLDAGPYAWQGERLSWGPPPSAPAAPLPTAESLLLPAPKISLPLNGSTVSTRMPTLVQWSWERQLAPNQGFQIRFWHTSSSVPTGITPPIAETQMEVHLDATSAYLAHGDSFYYLDVVVIDLDSHSFLSYGNKIQIGVGP